MELVEVTALPIGATAVRVAIIVAQIMNIRNFDAECHDCAQRSKARRSVATLSGGLPRKGSPKMPGT